MTVIPANFHKVGCDLRCSGDSAAIVGDMLNFRRSAFAFAAAVLATMGGGLAMSPVASAVSAHSAIAATGGDKTSVDRDGTQGSFTDAVQGQVDSDGDQDAFDVIQSEKATPEFKAPNKMTR